MEIKELIISLLAAMLGSLGFSILFYIKPKRLALAAVGSLLICGIYFLFKELLGGEMVPNLIAAFAGALFSEICARLTKAPVPVYLVPSTMPLVPGGLLYETMKYFVRGAYGEAADCALLTLQVAAGISGGIIAASVFGIFLRWALNRKPQGGRPSKTRF